MLQAPQEWSCENGTHQVSGNHKTTCLTWTSSHKFDVQLYDGFEGLQLPHWAVRSAEKSSIIQVQIWIFTSSQILHSFARKSTVIFLASEILDERCFSKQWKQVLVKRKRIYSYHKYINQVFIRGTFPRNFVNGTDGSIELSLS